MSEVPMSAALESALAQLEALAERDRARLHRTLNTALKLVAASEDVSGDAGTELVAEEQLTAEDAKDRV